MQRYVEQSASPTDGPGVKARYLRWLYRRQNDPLPIWERHPLDRWRVVREEYERLFGRPSENGELEHMIQDVWLEARKLAGWGYSVKWQCWVRADGSKVINDDGSDWRHL